MAPWEPYTVNEDEEARYQEEERLVHQDLYSIQHQDPSYFNSEPTCETVEEIFRASPFCQNEDCVDITVHQPDESKYFFIIRKEWRHGRDNEDEHTDTVAVYYCIGGTIYQCPDLSSLLKYRLYNCVQSLNKCYSEIKRYVAYSPADGNYVHNEVQSEKKNKKEEAEEANVLRIIGEGNVLQKINTNKAMLDSLIRDMEKEFLDEEGAAMFSQRYK